MNKPNKKLGIVILLLIGVEIICSVINNALNRNNLYITADIDTAWLMFIYHVVIGVLVIIFVVGIFKSYIAKAIVGFILIFVVGYVCIFSTFAYNDWNYRYFKSPGGNNEIIVRDNGLFLFGGEAQVLKKKNSFLSELVITEYTSDNNPLEPNFKMEWINNNEANFTYNEFGNEKVTKIKFK